MGPARARRRADRQGPAQVAGRAGRKIAIKLSPSPAKPPAETLAQRKWREKRTIEAVAGEVVLDADKGVPLSVKLAGHRRLLARRPPVHDEARASSSDVSGIGSRGAITAPPADEVVATPERLREVDDRDFLLQGIAPPLRKNPGRHGGRRPSSRPRRVWVKLALR